MRNLFAAAMVLAGSGLMAPAAQAQKIAYLNSQRIVREAPGAQEAQTRMQQEQQRLEQRLQAMSDSLQTMVNDYQRQSVLLSPDEKKKREDAIVTRRQQMEQRAQILREEASNRQQELMDPVMKVVEDVIEVIRKEGGYGIIFDAGAGAMVAADTTLDLTSQVIARLKAQASGPTTAKK